MEDTDIKPFISLLMAAQQLGVDPKIVKGLAIGLGVELFVVHSRLTMLRSADLKRLKVRLDESRADNAPTVTTL